MYHGKKCVKYSCGVALKIESHTRRMDGNRRKIRRKFKCPKCKCPKCKHYGEELVQTQSSHSCRCKCRACVKRMVRCPVGRPYCRGRKTVKRTYMYHGKKCVKYSCGVALKIESHTRRMDGNRRKIRRKYKKKTFKALKREKKVA